MPPNMAEQMRGMADQMRASPGMAEQMRSMMQGMDPQQFKMLVRPVVPQGHLHWWWSRSGLWSLLSCHSNLKTHCRGQSG